MVTPSQHIQYFLQRLLANQTTEELQARLAPKPEPAPVALSCTSSHNAANLESRWEPLQCSDAARNTLLDEWTLQQMRAFEGNIENFIGTAKVPIGIAGPLRVNGLFSQGDYFLPLATTEAALVASYHRGSQLISAAGGCTAMLLNEGLSRSPGFAFHSAEECGRFTLWIMSQLDEFKRLAASTTNHGKLIDTRVNIEGNHVYLNFEFTTGDAAGQNMVTLATETICRYIEQETPVQPRHTFVEANFSGDKKASALSFLSVRGKKVTAEVRLSAELVQQRLHTSPARMVDYWQMSALGGVLSGTLGVQGHYANGLAALYIACGQDAACVAESAVGITRFELTEEQGLYASVTLPNLIVGTVGGGTGLPTQNACLEILGLVGDGKAQALAEVCAALCLAGELSIIGALCSGDFSRAHRVYARRKKQQSQAASGEPS